MVGRKILLQAFAVTEWLLLLSGCGGLSVLASKPTPRPTLNILPSFYKSNPAVPAQPAVYETIDACYSQVDWKDFAPTLNEYFKKGYWLLGHCDLPEEVGMPLRENAIDYGRYLGADVILYSVQKTTKGDSTHHIAYLVRPVHFRHPSFVHHMSRADTPSAPWMSQDF